MVRPAAFGFNAETALNNHFQNSPDNGVDLQSAAIEEFDRMVKQLRGHSINVIVIDDTHSPAKPDAIFPNNWISTTPHGHLDVFPMFATSRRLEKRDDIIRKLHHDFKVVDYRDWSEFEVDGKFLEGTGSMVMDHVSKTIYACHSERTNLSLLERFASTHDYRAIAFLATDLNGRPVYHTNVVMSLGDEFAVLCEEAIDEEWELIAIKQMLSASGHEVIPITRNQMHAFAGNLLQVMSTAGEKFIVMSGTAARSLEDEQISQLQQFGSILKIEVPTIEKVEGGSVRCMMAEIFLQPISTKSFI